MGILENLERKTAAPAKKRKKKEIPEPWLDRCFRCLVLTFLPEKTALRLLQEFKIQA